MRATKKETPLHKELEETLKHFTQISIKIRPQHLLVSAADFFFACILVAANNISHRIIYFPQKKVNR